MWGQQGGKQLYISSVEIWRCLTGLCTVLSSLSGASPVYHHHHFQNLSGHFYRSWQQCGLWEEELEGTNERQRVTGQRRLFWMCISRGMKRKCKGCVCVCVCVCALSFSCSLYLFFLLRKKERGCSWRTNVQLTSIKHLGVGQSRATLPNTKIIMFLTGYLGYRTLEIINIIGKFAN